MFALLFFVPIILLLGLDSYLTEKNNRIRYAPIRHRMKPGIMYPKWRLEEMLKEEQSKENK